MDANVPSRSSRTTSSTDTRIQLDKLEQIASTQEAVPKYSPPSRANTKPTVFDEDQDQHVIYCVHPDGQASKRGVDSLSAITDLTVHTAAGSFSQKLLPDDRFTYSAPLEQAYLQTCCALIIYVSDLSGPVDNMITDLLDKVINVHCRLPQIKQYETWLASLNDPRAKKENTLPVPVLIVINAIHVGVSAYEAIASFIETCVIQVSSYVYPILTHKGIELRPVKILRTESRTSPRHDSRTLQELQLESVYSEAAFKTANDSRSTIVVTQQLPSPTTQEKKASKEKASGCFLCCQ